MCTLYLLFSLMRIYDTPLKLRIRHCHFHISLDRGPIQHDNEVWPHGVSYPETLGVVAYCGITLFFSPSITWKFIKISFLLTMGL